MISKFLQKLYFTDALCLSYCILQVLYVMILGQKLEYRLKIITVYSGCLVFSLLCIQLRNFFKNNKAVRLSTLLYPILLLIPLYSISGYEIHMFFDRFFDNYIINYEFTIFSVHPTVWFQKISSPLLTEWMMFGYSFYLLLLPITTVWLYCSQKNEQWQHLLGSLMISFFICYIIFTLIPVKGPRLALTGLYSVSLKGYIFQRFTQLLEHEAMLYGGAFPSAHCSAATVMIVLAYKYDKKLFLGIAPIIITLYISTVYGRYHYPSDVLGGIIVGLSGIWLYWPLKRLWENLQQAILEFQRKIIVQRID